MPTDAQLDARLRALPEGGEPAAPVSMAQLLALRAGGVEPLEAAVAQSRAAREALATLAKPVSPELARWAADNIPTQAAPRASRARWIGGGVALALAAALAMFMLRPGLPLPSAYQVASLRGGEQAVRGEQQASALFLPRSRLNLVVVPSGDLKGPAPQLRVYLSHDRGPLTPAQGLRVTPKDGAYRLQAEAGTLFGTRAGAHTLFIGFAAELRTLEAAAQSTPQAARALPGVRWLEVPVRYQLVAPE